jgi:hypothetical protein
MAKMDLNEDDEKANIETIFWSAMDLLSDDDKKLPQASSHFAQHLLLSLCNIPYRHQHHMCAC